MVRVTNKRTRANEAAIFARLWETGNGGLSPLLARHVLRVGFSPADRERMHELAVKNRESKLNAEEEEELDSYLKVADLLAIMQSKARRLLRKGKARG